MRVKTNSGAHLRSKRSKAPQKKQKKWTLRSRENRKRLLEAGFTGKEIEDLFVFLEDLVVIDLPILPKAATKLAGYSYHHSTGAHNPLHLRSVQAAEVMA